MKEGVHNDIGKKEGRSGFVLSFGLGPKTRAGELKGGEGVLRGSLIPHREPEASFCIRNAIKQAKTRGGTNISERK